ncbi:MAG: phosphatidylserine decarboxylase family protein [Deltaproteobacteria bacterium]|nr:MAG: phosphatidylserine decarboxylase family protein [Deltaproteobacteria bacterium]
MRIAKEGYPFILTPALLALLALIGGWKWMALILGTVSFVFAAFFRDPERKPPGGEGLILSPADGRNVKIRRAEGKGTGAKLSIFLSPLDVHINRAPIEGAVEEVKYQKGRFFAAYKDEASKTNEQNVLKIVDSRRRSLTVVQVAGVLARRIVCYVKKGDSLQQGQRLGLIMFGSRVDLSLPEGAQIKVAEGERVKGGETIIGRFA